MKRAPIRTAHCEITETAVAADEKVADAYVNEISALGCEIALDDFGSATAGSRPSNACRSRC